MEGLIHLYEEKINEANILIDSLQNLKHVKGISKLRKLILSERSFLQKVASSGKKDTKHLSTSNLTHFQALVSTALEVDNCDSVLEPFTFQKDGVTKRIVIDIVTHQGLQWIKVTARNPKSLMMSCVGDTSYGSRTILEQAEDYVACADQNHIFYTAPKVIFKFCAGVDCALVDKVSKLGIQVKGEIHPTSLNFDSLSDDEQETKLNSLPKSKCDNVSMLMEKETITKLNLDTTALIAYVSDMTNGGTCVSFVQEPLTLQAVSEQNSKVKESLDNLFHGKKLYSSETAMSRFKEILSTVGGDREKARAKLLIERVTVVPDCMSERVAKLTIGGQVKPRPQAVFGTGDNMQALTVTANWGFYRSAKQQGVHLATFLHEPRALSEQASYLKANLCHAEEKTVDDLSS